MKDFKKADRTNRRRKLVESRARRLKPEPRHRSFKENRMQPCVVCRALTGTWIGRCTNGCCSACHVEYCAPGGATTPGHGLDLERARRLHAGRIGIQPDPAAAKLVADAAAMNLPVGEEMDQFERDAARQYEIQVRHRALSCYVLTAARTRVIGTWAAYVYVVPGLDHRVERDLVLSHGTKLQEKVARALYPEFDGMPYAH